jgi:hypothetical protein
MPDSDFDQKPSSNAAAAKKPSPATAPKPKMPGADNNRDGVGGGSSYVDLVAKDLRAGTDAITRLHDVILPSLEILVSGGKPPLGMPELAAWAALREIERALERTETAKGFTGSLIEIPEQLLQQRRRLAADYAFLKPKVEALSKTYADRMAEEAKRVASKSHDAPSTTPVNHEPAHAKHPGQTDPVAARSWKTRLAFPPKIDLGDVETNRTALPSSFISYLGRTQGPRVESSVSGDPSIKLLHSPLFLPASADPYNPASDFKFKFTPTKDGFINGVLELRILWDEPAEVIQIPVVGHSHLPGEPTLAEEDAAKTHVAQKQKDDARRVVEQKQADKAAKAMAKYKRHDWHYHSEAQDDLKKASAKAQRSLVKLLEFQDKGIGAAREAIGVFKRAKPVPEQPSLLFELAMFGLTVGTAGISNLVAKSLEPVVGRILAGAEEAPASKAVVGFFTDIVKQSIKEGGKFVGNQIAKTTDQPASTKKTQQPQGTGVMERLASADPKAAFFLKQENSLVIGDIDRADFIDAASDTLRPMLRSPVGADERPKDADKAIAAMHAIAAGIEGEWEAAQLVQVDQSIRHWLRYVAQTSIGSPTSVASSAANAPRHYDGLIDLTFETTQAGADRPVKLSDVRLNGVKKSVYQYIKGVPLISLGVPVRATSRLSPIHSLVVVRDADGNISFTDNSSEGGGSWFARRAGVHVNPRRTDEERGARLLIEEITSKSLIGLFGEHVDDIIKNDSDE